MNFILERMLSLEYIKSVVPRGLETLGYGYWPLLIPLLVALAYSYLHLSDDTNFDISMEKGKYKHGLKLWLKQGYTKKEAKKRIFVSVRKKNTPIFFMVRTIIGSILSLYILCLVPFVFVYVYQLGGVFFEIIIFDNWEVPIYIGMLFFLIYSILILVLIMKLYISLVDILQRYPWNFIMDKIEDKLNEKKSGNY